MAIYLTLLYSRKEQIFIDNLHKWCYFITIFINSLHREKQRIFPDFTLISANVSLQRESVGSWPVPKGAMILLSRLQTDAIRLDPRIWRKIAGKYISNVSWNNSDPRWLAWGKQLVSHEVWSRISRRILKEPHTIMHRMTNVIGLAWTALPVHWYLFGCNVSLQCKKKRRKRKGEKEHRSMEGNYWNLNNNHDRINDKPRFTYYKLERLGWGWY